MIGGSRHPGYPDLMQEKHIKSVTVRTKKVVKVHLDLDVKPGRTIYFSVILGLMSFIAILSLN